MTLTPAYGREYRSAAEVKVDFKAGKDFIIADITHQYSGKPANIHDLKEEGMVRIRYNNLRSVVEVSTGV